MYCRPQSSAPNIQVGTADPFRQQSFWLRAPRNNEKKKSFLVHLIDIRLPTVVPVAVAGRLVIGANVWRRTAIAVRLTSHHYIIPLDT
jgi:hypothetical protein